MTYRDAAGAEKTIECDDVVLAGGMNPCYDEALKFYGTADRFFMIGDCTEVGSVQTSHQNGVRGRVTALSDRGGEGAASALRTYRKALGKPLCGLGHSVTSRATLST